MSSYNTSTGSSSTRRPAVNPSSSWASVVAGAPGSASASTAQQSLPIPVSMNSSRVTGRIGSSGNVPDLSSSSLQHTNNRYALPTISTSFPSSANGYALNVLPATLPIYLGGSSYSERLSAVKQAPPPPPTLSTSHSSFATNKLPQSHRGVAFDVKETPMTPRDDVLPPLPSRWSEEDRCNGVEVSQDGFDAKFIGPNKVGENDAAAVRADHHMPRQCGIFYYEVTIVNKGREGLIGIGFCSKQVNLNRLPGWEPQSWGYHGDDGKAFCCQGMGKPYGPHFNTRDVIGCGVNFRNNTAFFTRNGIDLGVAFRDIKNGKLYPAVGMKRAGEHVRVNFGQENFAFDIEGYVRAETAKATEEIHKSTVDRLCPPLGESALIQALIASYLQHDGFVETAKAFADDLRAENMALDNGRSKTVPQLDFLEDGDAINRQTIRSAILKGDIDRALRLTHRYYPEVLPNNEKIHFRLRCRKFIEMMRQCAEDLTPVAGDSRYSSHEDDRYDDEDEEMDLEDGNDEDEDYEDDNGGLGWEMDVENEEDQLEDAEGEYTKHTLDAALEYGRELQDDFKDKVEMRQSLEEAFSLLAYVDPRKSVVAHLMDEDGRLPVAEELNSAILVSLGKSSIAPLERVVQQTTALVREVSEEGGPAALVNVQEWAASPDIASL